jgi:hypothetical protein
MDDNNSRDMKYHARPKRATRKQFSTRSIIRSVFNKIVMEKSARLARAERTFLSTRYRRRVLGTMRSVQPKLHGTREERQPLSLSFSLSLSLSLSLLECLFFPVHIHGTIPLPKLVKVHVYLRVLFMKYRGCLSYRR